MTPTTALLTVALAGPLLTQEGPAPEDVKAGWLGLFVWLGLALAVVFLAFSLRKHLKKVDFDEGPDGGPDGGSDGGSESGSDETNGSREPHGSTG
jgi:hypothetical protein